MTVETNCYRIPIRQFIGAKQTTLFQTLKQPRFSGQLIILGQSRQEWIFYLYLGRIIYATGGIHPVRRWRRNLTAYLPKIASDLPSLQQDLICTQGVKYWEYELLCIWANQKKAPRNSIMKMINGVIIEILFDITQEMEITFELKEDRGLSQQLVLIDSDQVIAEAWKLWAGWLGAKLADRSPNSAPIIKQQDQLQGKTSPQTFQAMIKLMQGKYSLRDLGIQLKRDVLEVTHLLMPYIESGLVELREIPDLPSPVAHSQNQLS